MASNNLKKISKERVISGIVLVVLALVAILPGGPILAAALCVISIIGFLELTKVCDVGIASKVNALEIMGIISIIGYYLLIFFAKSGIEILRLPI